MKVFNVVVLLLLSSVVFAQENDRYSLVNNKTYKLKNNKKELVLTVNNKSMQAATTSFDINNLKTQLITITDGKKQVCQSVVQLKALDEKTLIGLCYHKNMMQLVCLDFSNNELKIVDQIAIPTNTKYLKKTVDKTNAELGNYLVKNIAVNPTTKEILVPVNIGKKKKNNAGVWSIKPMPNNYTYSFDESNISKLYVENEKLYIHSINISKDNDIWLSFYEGSIGLIPNPQKNYTENVLVYDFNKNLKSIYQPWVEKQFAETIYNDLNIASEEESSSIESWVNYEFNKNKDYYIYEYQTERKRALEAQINNFSLAERPVDLSEEEEEKMSTLVASAFDEVEDDSISYESETPVVIPYLTVMNPYDDKLLFKTNLPVATDAENNVYVNTNLALFKLKYNEKSKSIEPVWNVEPQNRMYNNCFYEIPGQLHIGSGTAPTVLTIDDKSYITITDNDKNINLLVYDENGNIVSKDAVFTNNRGAACNTPVQVVGTSLLLSNAFKVDNVHTDGALEKFDFRHTSINKGTLKNPKFVEAVSWFRDNSFKDMHQATITNLGAPVILNSKIYNLYLNENDINIQQVDWSDAAYNSTATNVLDDLDKKNNKYLENNIKQRSIGFSNKIILPLQNHLLLIE
ncbi:MAG: hypothetical protein R2801_09285 [Chitinophagales bacterium]